PKIRVGASLTANPGAPYPVRIEADDTADGVVELGLDRDNDKEFKEENNEIVKFTGDRHERILFGAAGPGGSLLLQPQVEDWKADLDVTGVDGPRKAGVWLLKDDAKALFRGTPPSAAGAPAEPLG